MTSQPDSDHPIRLLLIDDHVLMRSCLANTLNSRPELVVVATADDGKSAIQMFQEHSPDVTLLNLMMPGMSGIECLRQLTQDGPEAKVLILSATNIDHDCLAAIQAGAMGFVTKSAKPLELVRAILKVSKGKKVISSETKARLAACKDARSLTQRQKEVLQLLRKGMSNRDIGFLLEITPRTAKAHVAAIMAKLDANDRAEAVARGFERGLLRP